MPLTRQDLTPKGLGALADWLAYCESIGWPEASMPDLERIWLTYRDKNGDLP
jgi:hypothetical protein